MLVYRSGEDNCGTTVVKHCKGGYFCDIESGFTVNSGWIKSHQQSRSVRDGF